MKPARTAGTVALLPCPFCGGKAELQEATEPGNEGGYFVGCLGCEACTRLWFPIKDSVERQVVEAWNRRQPAPKRRGRP